MEVDQPAKIKSTKRTSDEGYHSDDSPIKLESDLETQAKMISKESEKFKEKYQAIKIMYNSANGVIYEG